MNSVISILKKDLLIAYRRKIELLTPLLFFVLVTMLFPFAVTSDPNKLVLMGPGVIWISLLFASMLSIDGLFQTDFEDGTLEQIALNPTPLPLLLIGKLLAHWLVTALPLIFASFLISQFFFISKQSLIVLISSLLLGSPVLILIGAIGAALTLGLRNRGILLLLLVFPLYLPVLIFATGAVNDASLNLPISSHMLFLAAFLVFSGTFAPMTIAAAIKVAIE